jgi:hypothetical protein
VKIGVAAIADPARDRQHEIYPGVIEQPRQPQVVGEGIVPALRYLGHRHTAGAVGSEGAEQESVGLKQAVAGCAHRSFTFQCNF